MTDGASGGLIATAALAPLLADPAVRAEQVSQLVLGETAVLLQRRDEWWRVRTRADGYEGWVHAGYVRQAELPDVLGWEREATGWSEGAEAHAGRSRVRLPVRARVVLGESGAITLPDGRAARITTGSVAGLDAVRAAARREPAHEWALRVFEGTPYEWGGVSSLGIDCSGLVQTTYAARGVQLPRDSSLQAGAGVAVDPSTARPGDLIFFGERGDRVTHVAFMGSEETLIHSTLACGGVVREPWTPGSRAAVLRARVVGARRIPEAA
ncbi:MAG: NlpC/P60 family protein [Gemmatimonadales bacterium]